MSKFAFCEEDRIGDPLAKPHRKGGGESRFLYEIMIQQNKNFVEFGGGGSRYLRIRRPKGPYVRQFCPWSYLCRIKELKTGFQYCLADAAVKNHRQRKVKLRQLTVISIFKQQIGLDDTTPYLLGIHSHFHYIKLPSG